MAFTKVTSFFRTKKKGMLVGSVKGKELESLIGTIKESKGNPEGIVFFFFINDDPKEKGPIAGMSVAVGTPREGNFSGGNQKQNASGVGRVSTPKVDPLAGLFGDKTGGGKVDGEDW